MSTVKKGMGAMLLQAVERTALCGMLSGSSQLSKKQQGAPLRVMALQEQGWVLLALGERKELLPQLMRRPMLCPHKIQFPQSPQHGEELRGLPYLLTQLSRPGVDPFYLRGGKALGHPQ